MKMLQKISFMILFVVAVVMLTQNYSNAADVRYRMLQNGLHVLMPRSCAASRMRTLPYPPNENCGHIAGEINGYVQIPLDLQPSDTEYHCYSLYKGFWHYAVSRGRPGPNEQTINVPQADVTPIPEDSVVTVLDSNGMPLSDIPVRVVNPGLKGAPVSTDVDSAWLPTTDADYTASYTAMFNDHGYTTKDMVVTNNLGKFGFAVPSEFPLQAVFAAKYKGFWHYSSENIMRFPASQTLTMPTVSSLTLSYLGKHPANIQVMIADPSDNSKLLTADRYKTDTNGIVSYAVPAGTQFRFAYYNDLGTINYSQVVTAPVSGSLIVKATNNPELLAPANNVTVSVGQTIAFDWGNTLNAAKYFWLYSYNGGTWRYIDRGAYTAMNLSGLPNAGTWQWKVVALNSADQIIAESATRTINVVAASSSSSAKKALVNVSAVRGDFETLAGGKDFDESMFSSNVLRDITE